jgi:hypothetical protein
MVHQFPYPSHPTSLFPSLHYKKNKHIYMKECWSEGIITVHVLSILYDEFGFNCTGVPLFLHLGHCIIDAFIIWWDEVSLSC